MKVLRRWFTFPTAKPDVKVMPKPPTFFFGNQAKDQQTRSEEECNAADGDGQISPLRPWISVIALVLRRYVIFCFEFVMVNNVSLLLIPLLIPRKRPPEMKKLLVNNPFLFFGDPTRQPGTQFGMTKLR